MKPVVHVFARWWAEGPVKTRLAAELGQARAREIYRRLAEGCWAGYFDPAWQRWLWVEPAAAADQAAAWLGGADRVLGQGDGDLGARMLAAFELAHREAAPWSAVVGTDAPELDARRIREAAAALAAAELAIVPALDGGYALLAARRPHPELLLDMEWSTEEVTSQTLARAAAAGLRRAVLSSVRDIDRAADLGDLKI
ncbi:MAG: TIGR04282 family arsenosugar biosynthesis glycosyltransferase [Planctomycetes bacterium]|nr:TIGR04282 family arsenosugar biosynthesis glycosyltransferase [Planctomycetota bacterium]MBL7008911.1 TIGR04282 family arsenosugar biosynthesis glycosyltransferase [Planctomycetota bacterium]